MGWSALYERFLVFLLLFHGVKVAYIGHKIFSILNKIPLPAEWYNDKLGVTMLDAALRQVNLVQADVWDATQERGGAWMQDNQSQLAWRYL